MQYDGNWEFWVPTCIGSKTKEESLSETVGELKNTGGGGFSHVNT